MEVSYKALEVDRWETVCLTLSVCVLVVCDTLWGVTRVKCSGIVLAPHVFSGLKSWDADPEDLKKRAASAGLPVWEHSLILGQKTTHTFPASLSPTELSMGESSSSFDASPIISQKNRRWQGTDLSGLSLFICGLCGGEGGKEKVTNVRTKIQSWVQLTFILSASWSPLKRKSHRVNRLIPSWTG